MERLTLPAVRYTGGHPAHPAATDVSVGFHRAGVDVGRLFTVDWPALERFEVTDPPSDKRGRDVGIGFLVRMPGALEMATSAEGGCAIGLGVGRHTYGLFVPRRPAAEVRGVLADWVVRVGAVFGPPPDPSGLGAVSTVRAAGLGAEPLPDRGTLSYRVALAEQYRAEGDDRAALVLLRGLLVRSVETFGRRSGGTLVVRNNLAFVEAVCGNRAEAIALYWENLDDAPHCDDPAVQRTATRHARQNLAMLHNPRWGEP